MTRYHLRNLGHKPEPLPRVRSLAGARRALSDRGWTTVIDVLDAQPGLCRVPAAALLIGDIAAVRSEEGLGSLIVCAGHGRFFGWHDTGADVGVPGMAVIAVPLDQIDAAWRV